MKLKRVVGDIVDINPIFQDMEIMWVTRECMGDTSTNSDDRPSVWFKYNGWLYLAVCDYKFQIFETYDDWHHEDGSPFDEWGNREREINMLLNMKPTYIKAQPEEIFKSDLGQYCDFELDFIKEWQKTTIRDSKIQDILYVK